MLNKSVTAKVFGVLVVFVMLATTITSGSSLAAATTKSLSTNYTVVNLGSDIAHVTVDYLKEDGSVWPVDPANAAFDVPKDFGMVQIRQYFDQTMTGGRGSVVINSGQPLGAIVQIQARNQTPTMGAYTGFTQGSNQFYVPVVARHQITASGIFNSQIIIQNTDSGDLDVTVDLIKGTTTTYSKSITGLHAGQSFYYDLEEETNLTDPWIGAAVVKASGTGKIAVVTNNFFGADGLQTFNAFPSETIGPDWIAPLFFSRLNNGLSTVVTVQNISGAQIPAEGITLTCVKDAATFPVGPATITKKMPVALNVNDGYSFNPVTDLTLFPETHWGGSCQIDAGTSNIVAFVQMRYVGGSFNGMTAAYEAIPNSGSTNATVVVPLIAKRLPNGFASVVTVQNMNPAADAHVDLTYTPSFIAAECPVAVCDISGNGTVGPEDAITVTNLLVPMGGSVQQNHRILSGPGSVPTLPSAWQGSLVVTSDQPINGFVQLTNYLFNDGDRFMAHGIFSLP